MARTNVVTADRVVNIRGRKIIELNYWEIYDHKANIYKWVKRAFDVVAAFVALVLLSPVFLITAIAIFVEDGGPIFFTQQRAGKDMQSFTIYKFRSMYKNAEDLFEKMQEQNEQTGHAFKIKNATDYFSDEQLRALRLKTIPELLTWASLSEDFQLMSFLSSLISLRAI